MLDTIKKRIGIKRLKLYLGVGFAFAVLGILSDYAQHSNSFLQRVLNNVWMVSYVTILNYFFFETILPSLRFNRVFRSLLRLLACIFLYSVISYLWKCIGIGLHIYTALQTFKTTSDAIADRMSYSIASILFYGIIRHIYNYIQLKQTSQQLQIEKQQAELNYLKSQTNPHFLFNTLNNIYSLAREKSDVAPESILRLSKMLRYMLYETSGNYIAIEQELKIISDYIALEQLRYDESLRVNFNYDIEDMKQALPPLLLIPLVENAFKHGVSETRSLPFVDIHLSVKQRRLTLMITNSTDDPAGEKKIKENIGLSNLRRQLQLLYTDYNLSVRHEPSLFTTTLQINLASHV